MGLETATIVMATVAAGAEIGKAAFQVDAASEKEKALELQAKQMRLQTQQKTLQNYDVMEKAIAAQSAHMAATGTAFSSPSFNAIQRETLNIGARRQKNIDIENSLAEQNIDIEKRNVKKTLFAQLFGDVAEVGMSAASIAQKAPSVQRA